MEKLIHAAPGQPLSHLGVTHAYEAGGRTCRSVENKRGTETAYEYKDHEVSDDYQHKERKRRRGLKRKVSAHSSEEGERGVDRRGETNAEQTSDDISQEGTPEPQQHTIMEQNTGLLCTHTNFNATEGYSVNPLTSKLVLAFFSTSRVLDTAENHREDS